MKEHVNRLFVQVVMVLVEMGQISMDVQYIDGSKIESVANKYTFVWRKSTETNKKKLEAKIQNILSQIDEGIAYMTNFGLYWNPGDTLTLPSFLTLGMARFGKLPRLICADSGYGSEENYEWPEKNNIEAFVKYNYFHKEQRRSFRKDAFRQENLYYNKEEDSFVCPMGQHRRFIGKKTTPNDHGYQSEVRRYRAERCQGCPLKSVCTKAKEDRIIEVNFHLMNYKQKARELLLSEEGVIIFLWNKASV